MEKSAKRHVESLLMEKDFNLLIDLCDKDRNYWQAVRFRLYDLDEIIRWAAIEAVAKLMQRWWQSGKRENVRNYIRTLFWSISDESGGIGWSAPQTIAEIIAGIPELIDPYGSMMIALSIEEPPLMKGCLWGIGRIGKGIAGAVEFFKNKVLAVFQFDDIEILGLAAWAMGEVGYKPSLPFLKELRENNEKAVIYNAGNFQEKSIQQWATEAIAKIEDKSGNN